MVTAKSRLCWPHRMSCNVTSHHTSLGKAMASIQVRETAWPVRRLCLFLHVSGPKPHVQSSCVQGSSGEAGCMLMAILEVFDQTLLAT
jgi:hypothetical protein